MSAVILRVALPSLLAAGCQTVPTEQNPARQAIDAQALQEAQLAAPDAAFWTCPMHPGVQADAAGACPTCKMPLVEHKPTQKAQADDWTCPMHPGVHEHAAGACPTCKMPLVKSKAPQEIAEEPAATWTCPMHRRVQEPGPGPCPKCNMPLQES